MYVRCCTRRFAATRLTFIQQRDLDKLFKDYNVQENIDVLHKLVTDAKERKTQGELGKDVWKEDLEPRVAVCARTIPILDAEVKRLREQLAKVRANSFDY